MLLPILLNSVRTWEARVLIATMAPKAITAATRAYSIRSCPDSSQKSRFTVCMGMLNIISES